VIIAKPQTFMNLSGQAVSSLMNFYKVPLTNLLIVHDDIDLPIGTIRIRPGGGSAGQRGLASIIEKLGTREFPRLRVGVGRPPGQKMAADYVLDEFHKSDQPIMERVIADSAEAIRVFLAQGLEKSMNTYNGVVDPIEE
jgi:PTH1 family peptidyl-tRNA hydrolase